MNDEDLMDLGLRLGARIDEELRFSALEGGRSDTGGRWKGRRLWNATATDEEEVRGEA